MFRVALAACCGPGLSAALVQSSGEARWKAEVAMLPESLQKACWPRLATACLVLVILVLGCGRAPDSEAEYSSRIGRQWHPVAVRHGQASLGSGADTVDCRVKAYGWKMLGEHRVKSVRDAWFQRGRAQQKWGWKLLVHNAGTDSLIVNITVHLMTDEDMLLQRTGFGRLAYMTRISPEIGGPSLGPEIPDNLVEPGETRLFSGTSWYWLDEHRREGRPDRIRWFIKSLGSSPGSRVVAQTLAAGEAEPSG
ncbi:MAG: hypothetical protein JXA57_13790 [Armatimonadetes bacterium]|nr:hypothetical protein [Armatimonadota bacterium]